MAGSAASLSIDGTKKSDDARSVAAQAHDSPLCARYSSDGSHSAVDTPPTESSTASGETLTPELISALIKSGYSITIPSEIRAELQKIADGSRQSNLPPFEMHISAKFIQTNQPVHSADILPQNVVDEGVTTNKAGAQSLPAIEAQNMASEAVITSNADSHSLPPVEQAEPTLPSPPTVHAPSGEDNSEIWHTVGNLAARDHDSDAWGCLGLPTPLCKKIAMMGFEHPTECQQKAIPSIKDGRDVLLQSVAGSGKTGTFLIGGLCQLMRRRGTMLILSPNKYLAQQTAKVARQFTPKQKGIEVHCSYGGKPKDSLELRKRLRVNKSVVLSATLGRALQHLDEGGPLNPDSVRLLVVDEFDKMLNEHHDEMKSITRIIPSDCQVVMVSATADGQSVEIARNILRDPAEFAGENRVSQSVSQYTVDCSDDVNVKYDVLIDLLPRLSTKGQVIIFSNDIQAIDTLSAALSERGAPDFGVVHSQIARDKRDQALQKFCQGVFKILIASDTVSRGFDLQHVRCVINFDVPSSHKNYVHRANRAGRQGRCGIVITLSTSQDYKRLEYFRHAEHGALRDLTCDAIDNLS